jgi:serine-type D-Ala-D-Ala carboxypeptidase (penicillin-binding protein 5/6)
MLPALRSVVVTVAVAAFVLPFAVLTSSPVADASSGADAVSVAGSPAATAARKGPTGITAGAGELIDASAGAWLWSRGLYSRHPIASITKVMTALVVIAQGDLSRKIRVTEAAEEYARENSAGSADLVPGDVMTARQLLWAMLLPSGADAAYLLAHAYGPGWHAFVRKMNRRAAALGMTGTHFANFDGLPWPTPTATYSTPRDLIRLGEAAMKVPLLREIVRQRNHWIGRTSQHHRYHWVTTNLLLGSYSGAIGIKTGYTSAAGYCLLFAADRGGRELMGVVLDSTDSDTGTRFLAARRLLSWGFAVTKPKPKPSPSPSPSSASPVPSASAVPTPSTTILPVP